MPKKDENDLWVKACCGDNRSLELLYHSHAKGLYQYGLNFTSKTELIEDVIQDLFIRIFNNKETHSREVNVKSYLIKSFRNNLFRILEKERKYFYAEKDDYCFDVTFSIEHRIMATEEDLIRKRKLVAGISRLTSKQKEIIYLRYTRGFDYDEISDILNMGIESCRNATCRAVRVLRAEIKREAMVLLHFFKKNM